MWSVDVDTWTVEMKTGGRDRAGAEALPRLEFHNHLSVDEF
jgi:hypothetical protein